VLNIPKANPEVIIGRMLPVDVDFQIALVMHIVIECFRMAFAVKLESVIVASDRVVRIFEPLGKRKVDPSLVMAADVRMWRMLVKRSRLALVFEGQNWLRMGSDGEESASGTW